MDLCVELIVPIYGIKFDLILVNDIWDYHVRHNIEGDKSDVDKYGALVLQFNNGEIRLLFRDDFYSIGCVSHEAFHLTCTIMRAVGIPLTQQTEEAYAYLLTHLCDIIVENLMILKVKSEDFKKTIPVDFVAN